MNKTKKILSSIILILSTILSCVSQSLVVEAAETEWNFGYTGAVQEFVVPYDGDYKIEAFGAKGGDYGSNIGGNGGKVVATLELKKNDVLKIYNGGVGNQYAGGWGNVKGGPPGSEGSGGGGSTEIYVVRNGNWNRVMVAGGGGGANRDFNGGQGGNCVYDTGGLSGGSGGSGGGYSYGVSGQLISVDVPFIHWTPEYKSDGTPLYPDPEEPYTPDMMAKENWTIQSERTNSGHATTNLSPPCKIEFFEDLYLYGQMPFVKNVTGEIYLNSGWFNISGSKYIYVHASGASAETDLNLDMTDMLPDIYGSKLDDSYIRVIGTKDDGKTEEIIKYVTFRDILNGEKGTQCFIGWNYPPIPPSEAIAINGVCYYVRHYYLINSFKVPDGVTKVRVEIKNVYDYKNDISDERTNRGKNGAVSIQAFYGSRGGFEASGGSNHITTGFSAKDTSSQNGINSGNGYTKITALHTHVYTSQVTTAATCTEKGVKTYTCSCGDSYTEEIAALGHACPTDYSYANNNNITNGLAYKNCTRCSTRLDSKWLNRIRVRYENADGTFTEYSNAVNGYYYSNNTISWSKSDATYKSASASWTSTTSAKSVDLTVYRNKYTITLNKGTGISSVSGAGTYRAGQSVSIDAVVKTGYTWKNWTGDKTSSNKAYSFTMPTSNVTDTANATAIVYTISYTLNSGTNNASNPATYTVEDAITLKNPTRKGYDFLGWYTDSNFTNKITSIPKGSTGSINLYAKWELHTYTIYTYIDKGYGAISEDQKVLYLNNTSLYYYPANGYDVEYVRYGTSNSNLAATPIDILKVFENVESDYYFHVSYKITETKISEITKTTYNWINLKIN